MTQPDAIGGFEDIWRLQSELNARAGIDTRQLGREFRQAQQTGDEKRLAELRLKVGRWMKNYLDALSAECHELQDTLHWKHWYREAKEGRQYELHDPQNAAVEVVDMLFFWVSLCQLLGLEVDDVLRLYAKKLNINHRRQDEKRSQAEHASHEQENREVV
ncbi:MAG: hypothetical protein PHU85_01095 [Phycisphaerae bacterium]|nr:hypothetical protein [Phycisphaerae bacterium]